MAKKSWIEREKKKRELVAKYAAKRAELKANHAFVNLVFPVLLFVRWQGMVSFLE